MHEAVVLVLEALRAVHGFTIDTHLTHVGHEPAGAAWTSSTPALNPRSQTSEIFVSRCDLAPVASLCGTRM